MANEVANAVNEPVAQDATNPVSATEETTSLEVVRDGPELNPNDYLDSAEPEADTEAESVEEDAAETETEPQTGEPLTPKAQNRVQQAVNEKNEAVARAQQLEQEIANLRSREAQVATEQELLGEVNPETGDYYTPQEVERIAFQQSRELQAKQVAEQRESLEVQKSQLTLASEANQVTTEIPILREFNSDGSKNPEYNPAIAAEYDSILGDNLLYRYSDGNVYTANVLMANGIDLGTQATLVGANTSPYKLAKSIATAYNASAVPNQIKGQKATEKMLAEADSSTSAKPTKTSAADDASMSPSEYAATHGLEKVW